MIAKMMPRAEGPTIEPADKTNTTRLPLGSWVERKLTDKLGGVST
jgi:hypothetical protein